MLRIFLTVILPLVLPTAGYVLYVFVVERRRREAEEAHRPAPWWATAPWPWLVFAGVAAMAVTLGAVAMTSGVAPHTPYTPAHLEDGRVIGGGPSGNGPSGSGPSGN